MGDAEAIGLILTDLIDLLKHMRDNPVHNEECLTFGIRLLQYVNYLCREQGIDLDAPIYYDTYFSYLMDLENKEYLEGFSE